MGYRWRLGLTLVEILVALGLGGLLLGLGLMLTSQLGDQVRTTEERSARSAQEGGVVEVLPKAFFGDRILGLRRGDERGFVAYVPLREAVGTFTDLSGSAATLGFSSPLPAVISRGAPVFLERQGVVAFGSVASATGSSLTVSIGNACVQAFSSQGGGPVKVWLLREKSLAFDPNSRTLTLTEGNTSTPSEPLGAEIAFGYVYGNERGEVLRSAATPNPGTVLTQGESSYLLRAIVLRTVGGEVAQGAIARIPVQPLGSGLCAPGTSSNPPGGSLRVNILGPDPFFATAYAQAPEGSKVRVSAGGTTVLPTAGTHTLSVSQGGTVTAYLISARENVGGRSLTYTYTPSPASSSFPTSALSPFLPLEVTLTFGLNPATLRIRVNNLPPGGTWSATYGGSGRYAQGGSIPSTDDRAKTLSLPPGVYAFTFSPVELQRTETLYGETVSYTLRYPLQSASPNPVGLSSGESATLDVSYSPTPQNGTLNVGISGLPSGAQANYRIRDASGNVVASGASGNTGSLPRSHSLSPRGYRVEADSVQHGGAWYDPTPTHRVVGLSSGEAVRVDFVYEVRPATLHIRMTGLPQGQGNIRVTGPNYNQTLTGSATLTTRISGTYSITANDVVYGGKTYRARVSPPSLYVSSGREYTVNVDYEPITVLRITFNNTTGGGCTNGTVRAGSYTVSYTASQDQTFAPVPPGTYTASFSSQPFSSLFTCRGSVSPTSLTLAQGETGTFTATITATDGALRVRLVGYPYATLGSGHITVRRPDGSTLPNPPLQGGTLTYPRLAPGTYTVSAAEFTDPSSGFRYTPSPTGASPRVEAGRVAEVTVTYTAEVPPEAVGLTIHLTCRGCTPGQQQGMRPMACAYLGSAPGSLPPGKLVSCPRATIRR